MASDNKKTNEMGRDEDDDPTVELQVLPEVVGAEREIHSEGDSESDQHTSGFTRLNNEFIDADEAISNVEANINSRVEVNGELQFEVELLRSKCTGFEKEATVLEEAMRNIAKELQEVQKKQLCTSELLEKRDKEIKSLRSQLLIKEQDIEELRKSNDPIGSQFQE